MALVCLLSLVRAALALISVWFRTGITVALVWGYSWIDDHLEVVGNLGHGWPVAWRREFPIFFLSILNPLLNKVLLT